MVGTEVPTGVTEVTGVVTEVLTGVVTEVVTGEADLNMASANQKVVANLNVATGKNEFNILYILMKPESIMPSGFFANDNNDSNGTRYKHKSSR